MATHIYLPKSQPLGVGWCGPTCLANALAIYGIPTTPEECAGACRATAPDVGATDDDVVRGMKKFGFRGNRNVMEQKSGFKKTLKWVRKQTDAGKIVFCGINGNYETGHWILILRVLRSGIHVWDPSEDASKIVPKRNLFKAWWNITSPKDKGMMTPSCVMLIAMSPRSKLARRAVEVRFNLLNPPSGELPVEKEIPEFEEGNEEEGA